MNILGCKDNSVVITINRIVEKPCPGCISCQENVVAASYDCRGTGVLNRRIKGWFEIYFGITSDYAMYIATLGDHYMVVQSYPEQPVVEELKAQITYDCIHNRLPLEIDKTVREEST